MGNGANCEINSKSWKHWSAISDIDENYEMFYSSCFDIKHYSILLKI